MRYDMFEKTDPTSKRIEVRWNIGDFLMYLTPSQIYHTKSLIKNCTVSSEVELSTVVSPGNPVPVYSAKGYIDYTRLNESSEPNVMTPWYLSGEEVDEYLNRIGFRYAEIQYRTGTLYPQRAFPLTFPHKVILKENEKGPYARIEMHPEQTGRLDECGKPFFPDATSRKHVCPGPAIIHRVFEKPTYGFMKVEMEQFEAPSDASLARWIMSNPIVERRSLICNGEIQFQHSIFGNHITIDTSFYETVIVQGEDGEAQESDVLSTYLEFDDLTKPNYAHTEAWIDTEDFIIQTIYEMSSDQYVREWKTRLVPANDYIKRKARPIAWPFQGYHMLTKLHNCTSNLIRSMAINTKFTRNEVQYVDIDPSELHRFLPYLCTKADLKCLLIEVESINRPAIMKLNNAGILKGDHNGMV